MNTLKRLLARVGWHIVVFADAVFARREVWAVVEPGGPKVGWIVRSKHPTIGEAWMVADVLRASKVRCVVRALSIVERENREIAATVYRECGREAD